MADLHFAPGGVEDRDELRNVAGSTQVALEEGKLIGKSLLYVGLGFLISLVIGFLYAYLLLTFGGDGTYLSETGSLAALITLLVTAIVQMILVPIVLRKTASGSGGLILFALYAILEGVFFGSFLIIPGVTYWTILEALGFTTLIFLVAGLVGWFAKKMSWAGTLGMMLLFATLLLTSFWGLFFLIAPQLFPVIDCIVSVLFVVAMVLFIGFDVHRVRKIAQSSGQSSSLGLFCGFVLYTDFMSLFLRILSILISIRRNN